MDEQMDGWVGKERDRFRDREIVGWSKGYMDGQSRMDEQVVGVSISVSIHVQVQKQKMDQSSASERSVELARTEGERAGSTRRDKGYCIPSFISKTYEILEKQDHCDLIAWGDTGTNFFVKNIKEFEEKILPIYFRHKNFASFVRQLNMYDFHKIRGEQKHIFEHKLFRRGSHHLLQQIKRKCFKKNREDDDDQLEPELEEPAPKRTVIVNTINYPTREEQARHQKLIFQKQLERQKTFEMLSEERSKSRRQNLELMEEILTKLKEINPRSESEIRQQINIIKGNPRYQRLRGKYYICEVYKKMKESLHKLRPRNTMDDLDELSIEEEIMYEEIEKPAPAQLTSITNFETENFMKSSHHTIKNIYAEEFFSKDMF